MEDPKFLTVQEVAAILRIHVMTVYRLIADGRLPACRFGRSYRIREADAQAYIAGADTRPRAGLAPAGAAAGERS